MGKRKYGFKQVALSRGKRQIYLCAASNPWRTPQFKRSTDSLGPKASGGETTRKGF
jgi:hypothetical protein